MTWLSSLILDSMDDHICFYFNHVKLDGTWWCRCHRNQKTLTQEYFENTIILFSYIILLFSKNNSSILRKTVPTMTAEMSYSEREEPYDTCEWQCISFNNTIEGKKKSGYCLRDARAARGVGWVWGGIYQIIQFELSFKETLFVCVFSS